MSSWRSPIKAGPGKRICLDPANYILETEVMLAKQVERTHIQAQKYYEALQRALDAERAGALCLRYENAHLARRNRELTEKLAQVEKRSRQEVV